MESDLTQDEQVELVQRHVQTLMEHFDCVQILVSNVITDGTANIFKGGGNWFGRQGMCHDFIRRDQAQTDAAEISRAISPPDE